MIKKTNKKDQLKLYFNMLRMRMVEEAIANEYKNQEMRCPVHLSIGQEAIAAGISINLNKKDKVFSAHRSHFHYLSKGGNLKKMICELYGKVTGCAGGKGGSMHLIDLNAGLLAAVPIVGSTIPIGVGYSWSCKLKRQKNLTTIYFGEGATEEGVFYESLNFAALHKLKILFICENNYYSVYSPIKNRQPKNRNILNIAKSLGIKSKKIDGNDVVKVCEETKNIVKYINKTNEPFFVELPTYRHLEHCGPNYDDDLKYRPDDEILYWLKNCPIKKFESKLFKLKILTEKQKNHFIKNINTEIKQAFDYAKFSKFPPKENLEKNIYAK